MNESKKQRVYAPAWPGYAGATDWVEQDGKRSYDPLPADADPDVRRIEVLKRDGDIIDYTMQSEGEDGMVQEQGQIQLDLSLPESATIAEEEVYIGLYEGSFSVWADGDNDPRTVSSEVVIEGDMDGKTLDYIGELAHQGKLTLHKGAFDTENDTVYNNKMKYVGFTHDGDRLRDKTIRFGVETQSTENRFARVQYFGKGSVPPVVLNGLRALKVTLKKGEGFSVVFDTEYQK